MTTIEKLQNKLDKALLKGDIDSAAKLETEIQQAKTQVKLEGRKGFLEYRESKKQELADCQKEFEKAHAVETRLTDIKQANDSAVKIMEELTLALKIRGSGGRTRVPWRTSGGKYHSGWLPEYEEILRKNINALTEQLKNLPEYDASHPCIITSVRRAQQARLAIENKANRVETEINELQEQEEN